MSAKGSGVAPDVEVHDLCVARDAVSVAILDGAEHCIRRFGIRKTSMADVAQQASVSRATLYNYCGDKDMLVEAVLQRANERFHDAAERQITPKRTLESKICTAVLWCLDQGDSEAMLDIRETEPETAALMVMQGGGIRRCLAFWPKHIQLAISNKEIRTDIDVDFLADAIHRIIASLVTFPPSWLLQDARQARLKKYIAQTVLYGVADK